MDNYNMRSELCQVYDLSTVWQVSEERFTPELRKLLKNKDVLEIVSNMQNANDTKLSIFEVSCGFGKTLGSAAYIALNWKSKTRIVYAASQIKQLESIKRLLIDLGVDEKVIGVYKAGSKEANQLGTWNYGEGGFELHPICLVTHERICSEPPELWHGSTLIIDEAVPLVVTIKINTLSLQGLIAEITDGSINKIYPYKKEWKDYELLEYIPDLDEDRTAEYRIDQLSKHLKTIEEDAVVQDLNRIFSSSRDFDDISDKHRAKRRKRLLMKLLLSILNGNYYKDYAEPDKTVVAFRNEIEFTEIADQIFLLDATAGLTPHLNVNSVNNLKIIRTVKVGTWKGKISNLYICSYADKAMPFAKSKNIGEYDFLNDTLYRLQEFVKADEVLVFTWLNKDRQPYIEKLKSNLRKPWTLLHYGGSRGTNDYRKFKSVILLGSMYKPPNHYQHYDSLGLESHYLDDSTADMIQEIYRSALRDDAEIDLYIALDERQAVKLCSWMMDHIAIENVGFLNLDSIKCETPSVTSGENNDDNVFRIIMSELFKNETVKTKDLFNLLKEKGKSGTIDKPGRIYQYIKKNYSFYATMIDNSVKGQLRLKILQPV